MRIIAGERRGKKLISREGADTRPTLDRVKQRMFDSIQFEVAGKTVLDLFAGSGQLGLESLSRGAEFCYFNDCAPDAVTIIEKNISACGYEKNARVTCNLYTDCVTMLKNKSISLVFLDPPYHKGLIESALKELKAGNCLAPQALIVCEHGSDENLILPDGFSVYKQKKCGEVSFTVVKNGEE